MRYQGDLTGTDPETYAIVDGFTGKTVASGLTDVESTRQRIDRLNAAAEEAKHLADKIATFVNRSGSMEGDEFVAQMSRQHRTLQQGFTGLCVAWIEHLAALKDGEFDGRNEASVLLAKQIVLAPQWGRLHFLPYI
jgi:hypothetical protein